MDRQTDYAYQVPYETDFLYAQRFSLEALGLLAMDLLGSTTLVSGLGCVPTGPASMQVKIQPGRIYSKQNLEDTIWGQFGGVGGLAVDTNADHQIIKQGVYRDTTTLTAMTAPGTPGQSVNYLIEAAFSEVDDTPVSLPFVSSTSPYPPIAPNTLNTVRRNKVVITVKAGTAATTGSQTTPAVDANNVGLWVVTIANGQSTIVAGNIAAYPSAPFLTETLTQKISQTVADTRYVNIANGRTKLQANTTFYVRPDGNDANAGTANTSGGAWLTIQRAWDVIVSSYDLAGFVATIQLGDGAYAGGLLKGLPPGMKGPASIVINGNAGTPANVTTTSALIFTAFAEVTLQNFKTTGAIVGIQSDSFANVILGVGMILATTGSQPLYATGGSIGITQNLSVSGNNTAFIQGLSAGAIVSITGGITITFTGTPVYSTAVFLISELAAVHFGGVVTFSGSVSGVQWAVNTNSVLNKAGSTVPGTAGTTATGGQVV